MFPKQSFDSIVLRNAQGCAAVRTSLADINIWLLQ
jgi:hypothetical protein